jgi:ATP-binding cassette subfamily E protein 1
MTRIAVMDYDRCKPKKCNQMCIKYCPMVRSRVEAVRFEENKIIISENSVADAAYASKMPLKPSHRQPTRRVRKDCSHRFGENAFKLFRLPMPSPCTVLVLLG